MSPAVGVLQSIQFLFYQMVLLQSICFQDTMIILIELFRMIMMPCLLVLIQDDRLILEEFPGSMDPHIALAASRPPVLYDQGRRFIYLDYRKGKEMFFHPVPHRLEVLGKCNHPVSHRLSGKNDIIAFKLL